MTAWPLVLIGALLLFWLWLAADEAWDRWEAWRDAVYPEDRR